MTVIAEWKEENGLVRQLVEERSADPAADADGGLRLVEYLVVNDSRRVATAANGGAVILWRRLRAYLLCEEGA